MLGCDRFGEVRMGWTKWEYSGLNIFESKEVKKTINFYSDLWMKNLKIFIDLIIVKIEVSSRMWCVWTCFDKVLNKMFRENENKLLRRMWIKVS